jgi:hypothetical protein
MINIEWWKNMRMDCAREEGIGKAEQGMVAEHRMGRTGNGGRTWNDRLLFEST